MLTVIDGGGESTQQKKMPIQINGAGLVDISTTITPLLTEQYRYEKAIKELNNSGKKRLYKEIQKEISRSLKKSSKLLKKKNELYKIRDEKGAKIAAMQYKKTRDRERLLWKQIKRLYENLCKGGPS